MVNEEAVVMNHVGRIVLFAFLALLSTSSSESIVDDDKHSDSPSEELTYRARNREKLRQYIYSHPLPVLERLRWAKGNNTSASDDISGGANVYPQSTSLERTSSVAALSIASAGLMVGSYVSSLLI